MFYVTESTPGYLPETEDPPQFDTEEEAKAYALEQAQEYVDDKIDGDVEAEGMPQLYHISDEESLIRVSCNAPHRLDRIWEITEELE